MYSPAKLPFLQGSFFKILDFSIPHVHAWQVLIYLKKYLFKIHALNTFPELINLTTIMQFIFCKSLFFYGSLHAESKVHPHSQWSEVSHYTLGTKIPRILPGSTFTPPVMENLFCWGGSFWLHNIVLPFQGCRSPNTVLKTSFPTRNTGCSFSN